MIELHEQYLVDEEGNRKAVVVPFSEWEHVLELLEEIRDIRAYDEAKRKPSDPVPFEKAVSEIDEGNPADNKLFDKDRGEDLAPTGRGNQRSEVGGRRSAIRPEVGGRRSEVSRSERQNM